LENKILFMIVGFLALYILYDGLFPPKGKKSYIDKTVDILTAGVGNSPKIVNDIKEKNEQEKRKAVKQGEIFYLFDKLKKLLSKK